MKNCKYKTQFKKWAERRKRIRELSATMTETSLAKMFGVSIARISQILKTEATNDAK